MIHRIWNWGGIGILWLCVLPSHGDEIARARASAAQGNWKATDSLLRSWKDNPARSGGSGEVLFWQGWSALHQGRRAPADSLFLLASAYVDEDISQRALEYRYALLLDTTAALTAYARGLPESPLPDSLRLVSLRSVPASSPLYPEARWQEAVLLEAKHSPEAFAVLEDLSRHPNTVAGRRAAAHLAFLQEPEHSDSALAAYERLLLEYQQGVPSEFARNRMQTLKNRTQSP